MNGLGKGIGIGLTALAIFGIVYVTKNINACWAFIILAFMTSDWD